MPFSPYPEPAGSNDAARYQTLRGPLSDYGAYITSCTCQRQRCLIASMNRVFR